MHAVEEPSKWSLLYYVPFWILWGFFLVLPFWMQWTTAAVVIRAGSIVGKAMLVALAFTIVPVAIGIDGSRIWVRRAIVLPLAYGLFGLFLLVPFFFVIAQTLRSFWR